jgi:hypothetical protein
MSLLDNAITSLHLGLEDYSSGKDSRLLSAVRNLHAGIRETVRWYLDNQDWVRQVLKK